MSESAGGFERLSTFEEAREALRACCSPHGRVERVPTADASGRVAARPVDAARPVPHYERVTRDGYAVRARDTFAASGRSPVRFDETGRVGETTATPVCAGDELPAGADAVVGVEHVADRESGLLVFDAVSVGAHVAPAGSDVAAGTRLVEAGQRFDPADLALARAAGVERVPVTDRPRVCVVPTGGNAVDADPDAGEWVETDGAMVETLAGRWGARPTLRDPTAGEAALASAVRSALDHDIVVTTGGTSVGTDDVTPAVLADLGTVAVHGVTIDPGRSLALGTVSGTPILSLPGPPVACYVAAVTVLRPAIAAVTGTTPRPVPTARAELDGKLASEPGTRTFARVRLERDGTDDTPGTTASGPETPGGTPDAGDLRAAPEHVAGAGVLSSVVRADGWVTIPGRLEGLPAGERVTVARWNRL